MYIPEGELKLSAPLSFKFLTECFETKKMPNLQRLMQGFREYLVYTIGRQTLKTLVYDKCDRAIAFTFSA